MHIVQKGDTMWLIAKKYGISLDSLIASNPQIPDPNKIDVGMTINIPGGMEMEPKPYGTKAMMTKPMEMKQMEMKQMEMMPMEMQPMGMQQMENNTPVEKPESGLSEHLKTMTYVVKAGDTLFKVAKMFGIPLAKLIAANPQIAEPDKIDIGQKIFVPKEHMPQYPCMQMPKAQMMAPMPMAPMATAQAPAKTQMMAPMPTAQAPAKAQMMAPMPMAPMPMAQAPAKAVQMPAAQAPMMQMPSMHMPPMTMEMHHMQMPPMHTTYFMTYLIPCCPPCCKAKKSKCKDCKLAHGS